MISIIIPAYKDPDSVDALLASLRNVCSSDVPHEVIVVDDGSQDQAFERVCANYPFAKLISLTQNQGAATARNVGARAARYELLLFLDSDVIARTDILSVVAGMFRDANVQAAVGGFSPEASNPSPFRSFWALVKAQSLPRGAYSSTFYPAIGAVRKSVFENVGGFNEQIRGASVEDYEISLRFRAQGIRVHYNADLLVKCRYYGMVRSLRQSFSRSGKWVMLFWDSREFDNHTTTPSQGAGVLGGAGFIVSALVTLGGMSVGPYLMTAAAVVYIGSTAGFFRYVAAVKGWRFVPLALVFHLALSSVVSSGVGVGLMHALLGKEHRHAAVYG